MTIQLTNYGVPDPVSIVVTGHQVTASGGTAGPGDPVRDAPPETVTYSFTAGKPGTYVYHSLDGQNPGLHQEMGLAGALIVRPTGYESATEAGRSAYGAGDPVRPGVPVPADRGRPGHPQRDGARPQRALHSATATRPSGSSTAGSSRTCSRATTTRCSRTSPTSPWPRRTRATRCWCARSTSARTATPSTSTARTCASSRDGRMLSRSARWSPTRPPCGPRPLRQHAELGAEADRRHALDLDRQGPELGHLRAGQHGTCTDSDNNMEDDATGAAVPRRHLATVGHR